MTKDVKEDLVDMESMVHVCDAIERCSSVGLV